MLEFRSDHDEGLLTGIRHREVHIGVDGPAKSKKHQVIGLIGGFDSRISWVSTIQTWWFLGFLQKWCFEVGFDDYYEYRYKLSCTTIMIVDANDDHDPDPDNHAGDSEKYSYEYSE